MLKTVCYAAFATEEYALSETLNSELQPGRMSELNICAEKNMCLFVKHSAVFLYISAESGNVDLRG